MTRPNFLFIMCDQLRADYLSCYGHDTLETPCIDSLYHGGIRFDRAYCQAPLCGPSRASFYTGRYASSHGAMANPDPLRAGELTMGDYLGQLGYRTALCGKSHTWTSPAGLSRLAMVPPKPLASRLACGGFEPWEVYEGLYPDPVVPSTLAYNRYLQRQGYDSDNPWEEHVNTNESGGSGWLLRNSTGRSKVAEPDSETAYVSRRAREFMEDCNPGANWCLHLSYIKPHWPLMAPAPYHALYTGNDVLPATRSEAERISPHPVVKAFMQQEYSLTYANEEMRRALVPIYMGLIKQLDDHLGALFAWMKQRGHWDNTVVIFTSDHGDYLGDHWLGEKNLFHEPSVRIPLIICDNRQASRGPASTDALVEAVDILPTLVDLAGGAVSAERLEGRSLRGVVEAVEAGQDIPRGWRETVVSEIDYSDSGARRQLDIPVSQCRAWMVRDARYKYIFYEGFQPQLFDLVDDPDELIDLSGDSAHKELLCRFESQLFAWFRQRKIRTELPESVVSQFGPERDEQLGIVIGRW